MCQLKVCCKDCNEEADNIGFGASINFKYCDIIHVLVITTNQY